MPDRWLQVKGDPSVRASLFQQCRIESIFDTDPNCIHEVVYAQLTLKGAFHVRIHYSSSQLTCWPADNAFRYRVFFLEEILDAGFLKPFRDCKIDHLQPVIDAEKLETFSTEEPEVFN